MITAGSWLDRYILLPAWLIDRSNLFQSHSMKNCNWFERWPNGYYNKLFCFILSLSIVVYPRKINFIEKVSVKTELAKIKKLMTYSDFSNYLQVFNIFITISSFAFFCLYVQGPPYIFVTFSCLSQPIILQPFELQETCWYLNWNL